MDKQHILNEIRRTAAANGGVPLGRQSFFTETGIKTSDWLGKFWARWGDALKEAGFEPNKLNQRIDDDSLLLKLISLAREIGRFPVNSELRLKARQSPDFPDQNTFARLGSKTELIARVLQYCREHPGFDDVLEFCNSASLAALPNLANASYVSEEIGTVYLLKSGKFYKIGRSNASGRREYELSIQLPERAKLVHEIRTDDPVGIEAYWHKRFELFRQNGEWFELSAIEVSAFRRRKFM